MTTEQKSAFTQRTLLVLLSAQADRDELDRTILTLTRVLADAHGIPTTYPPID